MHELHLAAPLLEAAGRHRRVDPSRQERRHAPGHAHRKAAGTRHAVDEHERLSGKEIHAHGEGRLGQVHARRKVPEDEVAQLPVDLVRRHREDLEGPARRDPERLEAPALEKLEHGRLHGRPLGQERESQREVRDPEHRRDPLSDPREVGVRLEIQDQAARETPDAPHAAPGRRLEKIPREPAKEQGSIAALEADLVVVDDHARERPPGHGAMTPARACRGAWGGAGRRSEGSPPWAASAASASGAAPAGARSSSARDSVLRAGERRHARVAPRGPVHLHPAPGHAVEGAQDAVVDGPAASPDGAVESGLTERG